VVSNSLLVSFGSESKFNEDDFIIKDFGIGYDGYPFLIVEGTAGRSITQEEDVALLYIFVTDNGTYGVMSDWAYTKWHSHGITLDNSNCIISMNNKGDVDVNGMIKLTNTNATKVDKVMTAEFAINDVDASICLTKIFDSAP
jgi:hypothetical protein